MVPARGVRLWRKRSPTARAARPTATVASTATTFFRAEALCGGGLPFRVDNARANRYDYDSHAIKARYVHRENWATPLELEIEGKYEDRQYKAPDPMIGTEREDTRWRFSAELRLSLTDYASWAVTIKNSDYDSNLRTASYSDLVVGTEIRLSF